MLPVEIFFDPFRERLEDGHPRLNIAKSAN
jgi:hypothetical protein